MVFLSACTPCHDLAPVFRKAISRLRNSYDYVVAVCADRGVNPPEHVAVALGLHRDAFQCGFPAFVAVDEAYGGSETLGYDRCSPANLRELLDLFAV